MIFFLFRIEIEGKCGWIIRGGCKWYVGMVPPPPSEIIGGGGGGQGPLPTPMGVFFPESVSIQSTIITPNMKPVARQP